MTETPTTDTGTASPPLRFRDVIAAAKLPEKVVPLCLRGDLAAQVDELEAQLAQTRPSERMVPNPERVALAQQIEALQDEMKASTVAFRLRALPRREFRALTKEHPPRDGEPQDQMAGVNTDTYFLAVVRRCLVEPELTEDEFVNLADNVLSSGQWRKLQESAASLNMDDVSVPFSATASILLRKSAETSKPPPAGESASNGSTGGNP